jgi:hypothetical protein
MHRVIKIVLAGLVIFSVMAIPATAGSPHFVGACTFTQSGNTVTVSCKEAGLGDEAQINVELTATALCINNGGHNPKAVNKTGVAAAATVPVQNGQAKYTLSGTATFKPDCSPPMTVQFTDITVTDTTNNLSQSA